MEYIYIVYQSNYYDAIEGGNATDILGVFKDKERAYKLAIDVIRANLNDTDYVIDDERNDLTRDGYVRLFYNNKENWRDYFEISVIRKVVT